MHANSYESLYAEEREQLTKYASTSCLDLLLKKILSRHAELLIIGMVHVPHSFVFDSGKSVVRVLS